MFSKPIGPSPDWPKVFMEWENSGESQRDFCAQRGYSFSRFKNARVKHKHGKGHRRARRVLPTPSSPAPKASDPQSSGFFAVSIAKDNAPRPSAPAQIAKQAEIELKLPFGVVLTFRGMTNQ